MTRFLLVLALVQVPWTSGAPVLQSLHQASRNLMTARLADDSGCNMTSIWPTTFGYNYNLDTFNNLCIATPQIPSAVSPLMSDVGPLTASIANTGVAGLDLSFYYAFTVCNPVCNTYCSGTLEPGDSTVCDPVQLLPVISDSDCCNNYTIAATFFMSVLPSSSDGRRLGGTEDASTRQLEPSSGVASIDLQFDQSCKTGTGNDQIIDRTWCHRTPVGSLDTWTQQPSQFYAPLFVGMNGCSVDADECQDEPGKPCCYKGFVQTGSWSNLTSCGDNCYDCSNVCSSRISPTPTATASAVAVPTSTHTAASSPTPSSSHSGAQMRGFGLMGGMPALLASLLLLLAL